MEVCVYRLIEVARQGILDITKLEELKLAEMQKQTELLQRIAESLEYNND